VIRAVLDTNVLASGAIASTGPPAAIIEAWNRREVQVILSTWIFRELGRTLGKPYFTDQLGSQDVADYLAFVRSRARFVSLNPAQVPRVATQREDDYVLATAVEGSVDYLVTGDRMVRRIDTHQGVAIVTPREFVEVLAAQTGGEDA
jgi:putative PIN family toxin of toxin-antitoxin system